MNWIKKHKVMLILVGIMILSSLWLIKSGMPYQHDGDFHSSRLLSLANTIKTNDFIALIHNGYYGFGYANGIFYSNFFFYINAVFVSLGMPIMLSYKLLNVFINILTVLSIYYVSKSISKDKKISVMITILYMFSLYRLVDVFVRSAMGEMLAFMIIPFVFLGLYEIVYRDYKKWYIFTISFVLLLLAHMITSILMAVFILLFLICSYKELFNDKVRIKYLLISGIIGVLLGCFYILPVMEQYMANYIQIFTAGTTIYVSEQMVSFKDFLIPTDLFCHHLGFSIILLFPIRYFIKSSKVDDTRILKFADIFLILGITAWIFTTGIFPWAKFSNVLGFIQFPWRLLIIATTFIIFSYIIYFKILNELGCKKVLRYSYIVILVISITTLGLYSFQYGYRNYHYSRHNENVIGGGEYLPQGINMNTLLTMKDKYSVFGDIVIKSFSKNGTSVKIEYENSDENSYVEIPLFNYIGYKADGAKIVNGNNNLIRLYPSDNSGVIKVYYGFTTLTKLGYVISSVTLVGIVIYIFKERKKNDGLSK